MLVEQKECFAREGEALGQSQAFQHAIPTTENQPIHIRPYASAWKERQLVQDQVQEMLQQKVIEPSVSPWSAPVVQQTWSQQRWDQPAPMGDTPEVANAKLEFFRAYNAAAKAAAENPDPEPPRQTWSAPVVQTQTWSAPAPVVQRLDLPTTDTPEVIAAKQRFFEAYNIAARAAALNPERK